MSKEIDKLKLADLAKIRELAQNFDVEERKTVLSCIPMNEILEYVAVVFEDMEARQKKLAEILR